MQFDNSFIPDKDKEDFQAVICKHFLLDLARMNLSAVEYKVFLAIFGFELAEGKDNLIACNHYHIQYATKIQSVKQITPTVNKLIERNMMERFDYQEGMCTVWSGKMTKQISKKYKPPLFIYHVNRQSKDWVYGLKLL